MLSVRACERMRACARACEGTFQALRVDRINAASGALEALRNGLLILLKDFAQLFSVLSQRDLPIVLIDHVRCILNEENVKRLK